VPFLAVAFTNVRCRDSGVEGGPGGGFTVQILRRWHGLSDALLEPIEDLAAGATERSKEVVYVGGVRRWTPYGVIE
jgi:hypothetical protein